MPSSYASGKHAIAECDRCGRRVKLTELRPEIRAGQPYNIRVCHECWDPDQPQLMLGRYPVDDPQAVHDARPDTSYRVSGVGPAGVPELGSRVIEWGWAPVGGARADADGLTPNALVAILRTGGVSIAT